MSIARNDYSTPPTTRKLTVNCRFMGVKRLGGLYYRSDPLLEALLTYSCSML